MDSWTAASPVRPVRPVLKWVGGKRQLLPELRQHYPQRFERYFEPFLGSGAVFLDLYNQGRLRGRSARLSDVNADVIGCYRMLRDAADEVIRHLRRLDAEYRKHGRAHFYDVRDARFNPARRKAHTCPNPSVAYTPLLAAMVIYLNRAGFNGLYRVNSKGSYNVPPGRNTSIRICDPVKVRAMSEALSAPGVTLAVARFEDALADAGRSDFAYLDPPYAAVGATPSFTAYTSQGFGAAAHAALHATVLQLAVRGAHVLLSHSTAPAVSNLYDAAAVRDVGLAVRTVEARRSVNARPARRAGASEYLITNVVAPNPSAEFV